ncbi:MAG: ABC transporter permease subunit [Clostridiales bacterium]|nr:ABC transporter permease subunit [Clostridiales bacterium]
MKNFLKSKSNLLSIKRQMPLQAMVLPGIIVLLIFSYLPMFGIIIAFKDFTIAKGFLGSPWVGLKHFISFFTDSTFIMAMKNTVILSLLRLLICFPAPIIFALILNEIPYLRYKKVVQTSSYFPHFIAYVVVAALWSNLLDPRGLVNNFLIGTGLISKPIEFWTDSGKFRILAIIVDIWKEIGWGAIIYIAAIAGINPELYESAKIDGASRIKQIIYITLPSIASTIAIMFILSIGGLFRGNLDQSYLFGNAFNKQTSYIIEYYVLDMGFKTMRYSFATAVNLFQSLISLILLVFANWLSGRISGNRIF